MTDTAIWAAALFIPLMTLIAVLARPLRRAVDQWGGQWASSAAERDATAQQLLAAIETGRHELAVRHSLITEETERERARLAAETAQYDTDQQAAARTLDAATEARNRVLAARAAAEAALAPDAARAALDGSGEWLAQAYAAYCDNYGYNDPLPFGRWIQGFQGVPRG